MNIFFNHFIYIITLIIVCIIRSFNMLGENTRIDSTRSIFLDPQKLLSCHMSPIHYKNKAGDVGKSPPRRLDPNSSSQFDDPSVSLLLGVLLSHSVLCACARLRSRLHDMSRCQIGDLLGRVIQTEEHAEQRVRTGVVTNLAHVDRVVAGHQLKCIELD